MRIVICFYGLGTELFTFSGEEKGWCWSPKASDASAPAHDALLNEEVEYFIG